MGKNRNNLHPDKVPQFFMIMFPGVYRKRVRLPGKIVPHLTEEAYKFAHLADYTGARWSVSLRKGKSGTFIDEGWEAFVNDHSIKDYYVLVFAFDGKYCFDVMIFDHTGCMREYVLWTRKITETLVHKGANKNRISSPIPEAVLNFCKAEPDEWLPVVQRPNVNKAKRQGESLTSVHTAKVKKARRNSNCLSTVGSPKLKKPVIDSESHPNVARPKLRKSRKIDQCLPTAAGPNPKVAKNFDATLTNEHVAGCSLTSSYRQPQSVEKKAKVQEVLVSFTSNFPYFLKCLTAREVRRGSFLCFPIHIFRKYYQVERKAEIGLINTGGIGWRVNLMTNKGRAILSGGWSTFVRANGLEEGDICIFEVMSQFEVKVHVY